MKGYYSEHYDVSDHFYTRIPTTGVNRNSWLVDNHGDKQIIGKEYFLIGYNALGQSCHVTFIKSDYYKPGTYIELNTSQKIVIHQRIVKESEVPKRALVEIRYDGQSRRKEYER